MSEQQVAVGLLVAGHDPERAQYLATLAGRLGFAVIHLRVDDPSEPIMQALPEIIAAAEPATVIVDDGTLPLVYTANREAVVAERQARSSTDGRPVVVCVPISIGRTVNEATARAAREPRFTQSWQPSACGVFGDHEEAQEQFMALARAGADVLVLDVPDAEDVADVLAQIRAIAVGANAALAREVHE